MEKNTIEKALNNCSEELGITLKAKQREALKCFCSGEDVFVILPTGYGKSTLLIMQGDDVS